MGYKDHFSEVASEYAQFRPHYPEALFCYLSTTVASKNLAWDCGTGTGQAAAGLAHYFRRVVATDGSRMQIANAAAHQKIAYLVTLAEESAIQSRSADLIVVAQAIHWFHLERFYREVRRVLKPGGTLAAWCYGLLRIDEDTDAVLERLHRDVVGPYWPAERSLVDSAYESLPFPFHRLNPPAFSMESRWDLKRLMGYLETWSAVRKFREREKRDPLDLVMDELISVWGPQGHWKPVRWPLHLLVGK